MNYLNFLLDFWCLGALKNVEECFDFCFHISIAFSMFSNAKPSFVPGWFFLVERFSHSLQTSVMDMAPLTLLPNLEFHLHFFASIMPNTLTTTTPINLPSSSTSYFSLLSSSTSPKILYALKGKKKCHYF